MTAAADILLQKISSYPFRMTIMPRYADVDVFCQLSRRALAEYHEESRTRFMVQIFGEHFLDEKRDYRMLPVRVSYEYFQEARYLHPLIATAGVTQIGTSSFEITMALFQDEACVSLSRATTVHVVNERARPLTQAQKAHLLAQNMGA